MNHKIKILLGLFFFTGMVWNLGFSHDTGVQNETERLNQCHKFCANNYPDSFELYSACMDGCFSLEPQ